MKHTKRRKSIGALTAAFCLVLTACSGGSSAGGASDSTDESLATPDADGNRTGTLVWAHDQEPTDLHLHDPENALAITSYIRAGLVEGLYGFTRDTQYVTELLAEEADVSETVSDGNVTISYTLRDDLTWSDGTPLTANDVKYTFDIFTEGCDTEDDGSIVDAADLDEDAENPCVYSFGKRSAYETITSFDVANDTEFSITMSEFDSGWKELFNEVYAEHAFGADAFEVNENLKEWSNSDGPLPSSGPLLFDSWDRGVNMSLLRNEGYHGSTNPDVENKETTLVEGVRIDWVVDSDTQINALKSGEANIIMAQPQLEFAALTSDESFTVASEAGPTFEHWGLNVLNPHLSDPNVREAMAYALDKSAVIEALYAPVFGDTLPSEGLGNTYRMTNAPDYEDHQEKYAGDQTETASESLEASGYVKGDDDIYEHPEKGRLSLRVGTTGGNALRERQQEIIQQQMKSAGIEIIIDNVPGSDYFSATVLSPEAREAADTGGASGDPSVWDITQFHWAQGPWPGEQSERYAKGGSTAIYGFQNDDFDRESEVCDATVDQTERHACYNEIDKYATTLEFGDDGLFMLPISQKPSFYGYSSDLQSAAVTPDIFLGGPLVNVGDFQFK